MSWFSILPESFRFIETWLIRFFLVLGALAMGPWVLLVLYDFVLFIVRTVMYDVPVVGGRARNRPRPRAPSLVERPSGRPRTFSMTVPGLSSSTGTTTDTPSTGDELKHRQKSPNDVFEDE